MGRAPCCSKVGLHRGSWSSEEDKLLTEYIQSNGEGQWRSMPSKAGLLRCGKSCRLRWMNYLRPGIKRGNFTADENDTIIRLHSIHGSRWSFIAAQLAGRTDNEVKNHWNAHLKRKALGENQVEDSNNKKKTDQKSRKVKIVEEPEETTVSQPASSSSSTLPSSQSALKRDEIYNNGVMSSVSSSSTTYQGEANSVATNMGFSWDNWELFFEMEGGARINGHDDLDLGSDGFDVLMLKDDESDLLEKLYDECVHLLEEEEGM